MDSHQLLPVESMPATPAKSMYSVYEVAKLWDIPMKEMREILASGKLPHLKLNRDIYITPRQAWEYLEAVRVEAVPLDKRDGKKTQLYRHFDRRGRLLYVGISLSAIQRLREHRETASWIDKIAKVTIENFPHRHMALRAEREAIKTEKPLHNLIHAGGKR